MKIKVPDVPAPKGRCWKQKLTAPGAMSRCTFRPGHKGPHSWDPGRTVRKRKLDPEAERTYRTISVLADLLISELTSFAPLALPGVKEDCRQAVLGLEQIPERFKGWWLR